MRLVYTVSAIALTAAATCTTEPRVNLGYSTYEGIAYENGVNAFLGMRYAAAPTGDNRLRLPQPPKRENGTLSAKQHGSICHGVDGLAFPASEPASEDCLFIDVWTPSEAKDNNALPVMIWISGGAYINLQNPNYNGTGLIEASNNEMLVVTFNYRVGAHGFLAGKDLEEEGNLNMGFHDQRMAINWVEKHISKFGGDPDKVTLFGTSIGAGSVHLHNMAYGGEPPAGEELNWSAGIAQATFMPQVYDVEELEDQYQGFLEAASCDTLSCLRSLSEEEFQAANTGRPQIKGGKDVPLFPYGPVVDGTVFPDRPSNLIADGRFSTDRPHIIGTTHSDGTIFVTQANTTKDIDAFMKKQYPLLTDEDLAVAHKLYENIPRTYPGVNVTEAPFYFRLSRMYSDVAFACPALNITTSLSNAGADVHSLRYAVLDPVEQAAGLLTPHTWEVQAVWGPEYAAQGVALPGANSYEKGGKNADMVGIVQSYWTQFAKSLGDPNAEGFPKWPAFGDGGKRLKLQTGDNVWEDVDELDTDRCRFWASVAERTRT